MTSYRSWHNLDTSSLLRAAFRFAAHSGAIMEGKYRITEDRVGGQRCLVIYEGEKPLFTIWPDDDVVTGIRNLRPDIAQDLVNVAETVKKLGGDFAQMQGALVAYFKQLNEKGDGDGVSTNELADEGRDPTAGGQG